MGEMGMTKEEEERTTERIEARERERKGEISTLSAGREVCS